MRMEKAIRRLDMQADLENNELYSKDNEKQLKAL
jgi:hypothetical protein